MARQAPEVMTLADMMKYLRTGYYNAKKLLEDSIIPANQINDRGDWRVLKSDVDDWLRRGGKALFKGGQQE